MNYSIKADNFVPRNGRILVLQDPVIKGVVTLTKQAEKAIKPNTGRIVKVDPRAPEFGFKEGDHVMFYEGSGILVTLENKEFRLMHSKEVLGDVINVEQA